jgi:hypothetical protein
MDAIPGEVELAADEPRRPLRAARGVHDVLPRLRELELHVLDRDRPEPLGVVLRPPHEVPVVVDSVPAHEPNDVRALEHVLARLPDELTHAAKA